MEIAGHLQLDATKAKVNVLSHAFSPQVDRIKIDVTSAYDVPELKQFTPALMHNREGRGIIEITDDFSVTKSTEVIEPFSTHGSWQKILDHTLPFTL